MPSEDVISSTGITRMRKIVLKILYKRVRFFFKSPEQENSRQLFDNARIKLTQCTILRSSLRSSLPDVEAQLTKYAKR